MPPDGKNKLIVSKAAGGSSEMKAENSLLDLGAPM